MLAKHFIDIARPLLSCPTAPFHEHFALAHIYSFVRSRPRLKIEQDQYGNLLLLYDGTRKRNVPRLIATAHLDHPGLLWRENLDERHFSFALYGGVNSNLLLNANVLIYSIHKPSEQRANRGTIIDMSTHKGQRTQVVVETRQAITPGASGTFATWAFPAWQLRDRKLHARVCDALAGAAVGLAFLHELQRKKAKVRAGLLLTRAEEVGFVGMLAALENGQLDRDALYINIECSSIKAGALMGAGPVIRVGDRICIFDPTASAALVAAAEEKAKTTPAFHFQRKLMDSGACEATPLVRAGLRTGAVALPLGNYHNDGGDRLKAECIHLDDALSLVELFLHLVTAPGGLNAALQRSTNLLDEHLQQRLSAYRQQLESLAFSTGDYP